MTAPSTTTRAPAITLNETFSFYVPASEPQTIIACSEIADAVTVKGVKGPHVVRALRAGGWDAPVLFDRAGYDPKVGAIDPDQWFDDQEAAGADRLLTAGSWIEWDSSGDSLKRGVEIEAGRTSVRPGATAVLAIDHRWLTRAPMALVDALQDLGGPVALILAHPTDPLGATHAVQGLVAVTRSTPQLSVLRTDHGGLGAVVHGACHAAIGLIGTYRHFVPVGKSGGGKIDDRTARVFSRDMLDWFTALTIAGWTTVSVDLRCHLDCCGGARLDRFFNPQFEGAAPLHNRLTLARLAVDILDAPIDERRRLFAEMCTAARDRYGTMGKLSMVTRPKEQLTQWAFI